MKMVDNNTWHKHSVIYMAVDTHKHQIDASSLVEDHTVQLNWGNGGVRNLPLSSGVASATSARKIEGLEAMNSPNASPSMVARMYLITSGNAFSDISQWLLRSKWRCMWSYGMNMTSLLP